MRTLAIAALVTLAAAAATPVAMGQGELQAIDNQTLTLYSIGRSPVQKQVVATAWDGSASGRGMTFNPLWQQRYGSRGDAMLVIDCCSNIGTGEMFGVWALEPYASPSLEMFGIEWNSSDSTIYGVSNGDLYAIDPNDGAAFRIGSTGVAGASALAYDSTHDVMYMVSSAGSFYSVDLVSGNATLIGPLNGPSGIGDLAYAADDDSVYLLASDTNELYSINRQSGATTLLGSTGPGQLVGLAWIADPPPPVCSYTSCWCDYDMNGGVDGGDLAAFFADYEVAAPCADIDRDGGITPGDIAYFLDEWGLCCC